MTLKYVNKAHHKDCSFKSQICSHIALSLEIRKHLEICKNLAKKGNAQFEFANVCLCYMFASLQSFLIEKATKNFE